MFQSMKFWLQMVVLLVQSTPSAWSINCTLNFLFTTGREKRLLNEHVWNDFFHSASSKSQYRIFIHNSMEGSMVSTSHIESQPVESTLLPGCSTQMSSIMQLLSSAAKLSAMGDSYLVLPADTVPVKTFTKTYMQFCSLSKGVLPGDNDHTIKTRRTTSSFCIAPYSQWIAKGSSSSDNSKNTTTTITTVTSTTSSIASSLTNVKQVFGSWIHSRGTTTSVSSLGGKSNSSTSSSSSSSSNNNHGVDMMMIPRHDPWMYLHHTEVQKILSQRSDACSSDTTSSTITGTADDRVNWWFYQILSDISMRLKITEQEQGNCHTYYVTFNHSNHLIGSSSSSSSLNKISSTVNGSVVNTRWGIKMSPSTIVRTTDRAIMDPSVHLIADLIHSPHFFFARGFRGNEPGHHIVGMAQNYSIQSGFHLLQIFGNHQKKHPIRERGKGDNGGLKVLIVSCDDREMKDRLEDDDYVSMTAVLVHDYAMYHGYDFMKLTGNSTFLVDRVLTKYKDRLVQLVGGIGETKYGPSAFHPGLLHFRASSWAKIPHVWYAVTEFGQHYDYLLYLDSDAAINPHFKNQSVFDALTHWQQRTDNSTPTTVQSRDALGQVYWGQRDVRSAHLMFFSNFPWRDDMPCAGIFLCRPKVVEPILREWWDYSLESRNRADFMEQDAMWFMLQAAGAGDGLGRDAPYGFIVNKTNTALISEPEFPSSWFGLNSLWFAHIPNYWPNRLVFFKQMLKMIGLYDPIAYGKAVRHVRKECHISVDILAVAEAMEALHETETVNVTIVTINHEDGTNITSIFPQEIPKRRTRYPREPGNPGGRADDRWHLARNQHLRPKTPPTAELYDGFVFIVTTTSEMYLIENLQRRLFPDLRTFEKMGYVKPLLLWVTPKSAEMAIPLGPPLPKLE